MSELQVKSNAETIAEIYRNAQLALTSISDIMPEIEDGAIREEIMRQHEGYEKISGKAALMSKQYDVEIKEPNPMKKAMMWSSIKMNTMADNSRSHIAQMMVQGTVMGLTSLKQTLTDGENSLDDDVKKLLKEAISLEEDYEERLKKFL